MRCSSLLFILWMMPVGSFIISPHENLLLHKKAPVIFAGECNHLRNAVAASSVGQRFLLFADTNATCAPDNIRDDLRLFLKMSLVIHFHGGVPVSQIDCGRMILRKETNVLNAHNELVQSMNLVRAFLQGGWGDLHSIRSYGGLDEELLQSIRFAAPRRMDDYYIAHPSRCLDYEKAMCRVDSISTDEYACSGHMLWLEHYSRHKHLDMLKNVKNPIGLEWGSDDDFHSLEKKIWLLNPDNEMGRIVIKTKGLLGLDRVVRYFQNKELNVAWCADVRSSSNPLQEIDKVMTLHEKRGSWTGLHLPSLRLDVAYAIATCLQRRNIMP